MVARDQEASHRRRVTALTVLVGSVVVVTAAVVIATGMGPIRPLARTEPIPVAGESRVPAKSSMPEDTPLPSVSPTFDESVNAEWRRYVSASGGFEVEIPANWMPVVEAGRTRFGEYNTELSASIGDRLGRVTVCNESPCQTVTVTDIEDLDDALVTFPGGVGGGRF